MTGKLSVELPYHWAGNDNWRDIEIDDGEVSYNANGKPLFRQCRFTDPYPNPGNVPLWRGKMRECGGEAWYVVTRTSKLTGNVYTDYACEYHAKQWIAQQAKIERA